MFTLNEIEEIILGMADIVIENRYLREENKSLVKALKERDLQAKETYKNTQSMTANLLTAALSNAHYRAGDNETAKALADKIKIDDSYDYRKIKIYGEL